jgi:hypothetical protein
MRRRAIAVIVATVLLTAGALWAHSLGDGKYAPQPDEIVCVYTPHNHTLTCYK